MFVGPVALAPYETPGTIEFARTILPFVQDHNTVLLTNHGVVCWADTVTHAEWYVEVIENYCKTLTIACQLGVPINEIPADKIGGLLAMKQETGFARSTFARPTASAAAFRCGTGPHPHGKRC